MADIFISYSKADRELALKLSAFLEAEGWTTWWDTSLSAGDNFRDEIMRELMAARAVVAIWTPTSIKSDWVRAEAGRAKAEGKLIPVKAAGVDYGDIPLPFGEMHTENVAATDLVRAAVVAQLAKPAIAPSGVWVATKTVRLQLLTWAGIIGGSITIFSNLRGLFTMADWVNWIVTRWHEWAQAFWTTIFSWVGFHLDPTLAPSLSFATFLAMLVIGTILRMPASTAGIGLPGEKESRSRPVLRLLIHAGLYVIWLVAISTCFMVARVKMPAETQADSTVRAVLFGLGIFLVPLVALVWSAKSRLQCLMLCVLLLVFWYVITVVPLTRLSGTTGRGFASFLTFLLLPIGAIAIVNLAPLRAINQRLLFLSLGALALIALNLISVFGLQRFLDTPKPPVQGMLARVPVSA